MISRKIFFVKAKLSLDNVKQARKALFKAITIRERDQNSVWAQLHWNRHFEIWSGEFLGHLCLLIDLTQRKSKFSPFFRTRGSFTTWREETLLKLGSWTPTETGDKGTASLLITFQREVSQVPEKDVLYGGCKTSKRPLKRFISQRGRERIHNWNFSKVNALKRRSGS